MNNKILKALLLLAVAVLALVVAIKVQSLVRTLPELVETKVHANNETFIPLSHIPTDLQRAIVATEDRSFYTNVGISFEGTARSLVIDLISGKYSEGGSTITQQLAREFFLTEQKTIARKAKEVILALMITHEFSKQDILAMYLNSAYFGHGAWGVKAAARVFFDKPVADLNIAQCTLLAGLPQAPSFFDPYSNYQAARSRQAEVLRSMVEVGDITQNQASEIGNMPLGLR